MTDLIEEITQNLWEQEPWEPPPPPRTDSPRHHFAYHKHLKAQALRYRDIRETQAVFTHTIIEAFKLVQVPQQGSPLFYTPVTDRINVPKAIERLYSLFNSRVVLDHGLFPELRIQLEENLAQASAGLTRRQLDAGIVLKPTKAGLDPRQTIDRYLGGTPLVRLFEAPAPFDIPDVLWKQHAHIVAGSGGGKTELLKYLVLRFLTQDPQPSMVVVDSQDALLNLIERKFRPVFGRKLIHIDPSRQTPALNLFDIPIERLRRYTERDREQLIFGLATTVSYLFEQKGVALTGNQTTLFEHVLGLLLQIPFVRGRPATFRDFRDLLYDPAAYTDVIATLTEGSRFFFEHEILAQKERRGGNSRFGHTVDELKTRLQSLISNPTFEKMLTAERGLDFYSLLNSGSVILINTNSGFFGERSGFLGRLYIANVMRAMYERTAIAEPDRHPTYFICDEAFEYFDNLTPKLLAQARKFNFRCILAHQYLSQVQGGLRSALSATAIKFVTSVKRGDAMDLAPDLQCDPAFLLAQSKERPQNARFAQWACFAEGITQHPVSVRLAGGQLEAYRPPAAVVYDESEPETLTLPPPILRLPPPSPRDAAPPSEQPPSPPPSDDGPGAW